MGSEAVKQFRNFQRLRFQLFRNSMRRLRFMSVSRLVTILLCSGMIWGGLFAISYEGFDYLRIQNVPLTGGLIGLLLDLFFLSLAGLLLFSGSLILYTALFNSPEAAFLLGKPVAADQVFAYKFQTAMSFSSWAFVLLGSPVLLAYGLVCHAPWPFYGLLPVFFLGFILLPGSVAGLIALAVANCFPQRPRQVATAVLVLGVAGVSLWGYRLLLTAQEGFGTRLGLERLVAQVAFSGSTLAPNHWMSLGLQAAVRGRPLDVVFNLALIWSNGLFAYQLTAWAASRLYRRGYNRVATGGTQRRRQGAAWLDRVVARGLTLCRPQTRLLLLKDFRTFRRDPGQWGQVVIFTGLLILYFLNVRRFHDHNMTWAYRDGVSLLNLTATALLLCAYTGRFIFPLLSLEGRRFWILGLLPLPREKLLWSKFLFSAVGSLAIAECLIILSDLMLDMSGWTIAVHILTVAVLAVGLSGLSVGLGALLANFRETDASKIAVGFGGTLNLVAGLLFLITLIGLMALPWHLATGALGDQELPPMPVTIWLGVGLLAGLVLGAVATVVPMRMGGRWLRRMEF